MCYVMNEKHYGRIKTVRKVLNHNITKDNVDYHYANAVCCNARQFCISDFELFMCMSRDGKNKMKLGLPNVFIAITNRIKKSLGPKQAIFLQLIMT